jgi:flagellar hook-associated protein 3 FlgL
MMIEIDKGSYIPMNIPGSKVFHGKGFAVRTLIDVDEGVPRTANELGRLQEKMDQQKDAEHEGHEDLEVQIRGPSSVATQSVRYTDSKDGENIFNVIRTLHAGLVTNDTSTIQSTLERLDSALNQVVMARSQLGSRVTSMNNTNDSLTRGVLDTKALVSNVEDVNAFEVYSEMSKNENTLKATLESSGRLIKPSLLDFLR